jgi:hypothetical protein
MLITQRSAVYPVFKYPHFPLNVNAVQPFVAAHAACTSFSGLQICMQWKNNSRYQFFT